VRAFLNNIGHALRKEGAFSLTIDLKGVTFSILLAALGVCLVLIGAVQKLSVAGADVEVTDIRFRLALCVLGATLLVGASVFQIVESRGRRDDETAQKATKSPLESTQTPAAPTAQSFFLTVDDKGVASFPKSVEGAVRLQILARTIVNLVGQYGQTFASLAIAGCEVQILIVDPASESARHIYGNNYSLYMRNAHTALTHIIDLQKRYGDRIRVRFFPYVPTVSIMNIEHRDAAQSFVQVQIYLVHGAIGRDRPVFRVYRTDPWYNIFRGEFDSIWKSFPDADVASAAAKL